LTDGHAGDSHVYYLEVSWAESLRRHATRAQSADFTPEQMRDWFVPGDTLGVPGEHVVPPSSTLDETVELIFRTSSPGHGARRRSLPGALPALPQPRRVGGVNPTPDREAGTIESRPHDPYGR
jgi:hypothetical protein